MLPVIKSIAVICGLIFFNSLAKSQDYGYGSAWSIGETGVSVSSAFNGLNNPSLAALNQTSSIGLGMRNYYLLENLNQYILAGNVAINNQSFGGGIVYYGDANFNETKLTLNYSRLLGNQVAVGTGMHFINQSAIVAESAGTLYPSLTLAMDINNSFSLGFKAENPLQQELKPPFEQQLESLFSLGANYATENSLDIAFQFDLGSQTDFSIGAGLQYVIIKNLKLSGGYRTTPSLITAGLVFSPASNFSTAIGSAYHNDLGLSPHAYFGYSKEP